ncbi:D-3-phosphoglycerate dehydrogenase [Desulfacinum infernum DSM 9756]|uniref:D-3-phosphoglycerate dehydrogenase n=1 Tax=Desulfacinum infernum DSM 9756 TaxID=1121391 RepID=A0A1M4YDV0_9BACT|nr:phosphoglycerate dehydrogenase [Desulfacinum infernum]SHF03636.1 D-3-phosphoglycerate dehydrogenase [Desulfacinum infernum DSM 9756]
MKVLVSDALAESGIEKLRAIPDFEVEVNTSLTHEELCQIIKEYDALVIRSATKVTREVIENADRLKVIARAGIGLDNVDISAATKRGIVVMNTPEGNVITTAEHTIAMLMALSRNIPQATQSMKAGKWEKKKFRGKEVFNKTLGIIGIGRIGRVVADRAKGLKMNVIAFDPYIGPETINKLGVEAVTLEELLARADYITVHTPMTQETRNLINKDAFRKMKRGVFIINCARGGIVNEQDLYDAIQEGIVAGAALDVFVEEPPKDHPLLALDKVIATPHLGASTDEAQENVALAVADQVIDYLLHGTIRNAVNAPAIDGEVLATLWPYLQLAEKLGSLVQQITPGAPEEISVEYVGEVCSVKDLKPLTISVLKGILTPMLGEQVNFVNAPVHAKERGIRVTESTRTEAEDFTNLISIYMKTSKDENLVAGTIFGKKDVRLVRINDFRLEAAMEGHLVLIYNIDTPGTIGAIGTCLGRHNINISMMDVGQVLERGQNIIFLRTDTPVPENVVQELLSLENVNIVQILEL